MTYKCMFCNKIETKYFNDLKKHFIRKKMCKRTKESYLLSDDQLFVLNLLPNNEENNTLISETVHLNQSNIIIKNKKELFTTLNSIEKNKDTNIACCIYCNKGFNLVMDLKKHIILNCFYNKLIENNIEETNIENNQIKEIDSNNFYSIVKESINTKNIVQNNSNIEKYINLKKYNDLHLRRFKMRQNFNI